MTSAGAFENDTAREWVQDLVESSEIGFLRRSLHPGNPTPEPSEAEIIRAAAEVIAAGMGLPRSGLPSEVRAWLAAHKRLDLAALLPLARVQLGRVLAGALDEPERAATAELLERLTRDVAILPGCKMS